MLILPGDCDWLNLLSQVMTCKKMSAVCHCDQLNLLSQAMTWQKDECSSLCACLLPCHHVNPVNEVPFSQKHAERWALCVRSFNSLCHHLGNLVMMLSSIKHQVLDLSLQTIPTLFISILQLTMAPKTPLKSVSKLSKLSKTPRCVLLLVLSTFLPVMFMCTQFDSKKTTTQDPIQVHISHLSRFA